MPLEDLEHAHRVLQRLVAAALVRNRRAPAAVGLGLGGDVRRLRLVTDVGLLAVELLGQLGLAVGRMLGSGVAPRDRVVVTGLRVEAGEQPVEVLGVGEVGVDDVRGVGVGHDVLTEVEVVVQHVVDEPAEPGDVGAGPDGDVDVGDRGGAREPGIDVDHRGTAPLGLHYPLEAHGVGLGHVGALDEDAVSVLQVLQLRRGAATRRVHAGGDFMRINCGQCGVAAVLGFIMFGMSGCASPQAHFNPNGMVFYCDGAGGGGITNWGDGVKKGLNDAGYPGGWEEYDWETGLGVVAAQVESVSAKRAQGNKLAKQIMAYQSQYPDSPVNLIGLSAGTAIAIYALEALPDDDDNRVDTVVMLSSSVASDYDLTQAL